MSLLIAYSWTLKSREAPLDFKGQAQQREVPKYFGGAGRINLIGSLSLHSHHKQLDYRLLESKCTKEAVVAFLDAQAEKALKQNRLTVIVLDNASFHRAKVVRSNIPKWRQQNFFLYYLPPYSPQLNLIETIWKRLKAFLMPRRHYPTLTDLKQALLEALQLLGGLEVQS